MSVRISRLASPFIIWWHQCHRMNINFYLRPSTIEFISSSWKDSESHLILNCFRLLRGKEALVPFLSHKCQLSPWRCLSSEVFRCFTWELVIQSEKTLSQMTQPWCVNQSNSVEEKFGAENNFQPTKLVFFFFFLKLEQLYSSLNYIF